MLRFTAFAIVVAACGPGHELPARAPQGPASPALVVADQSDGGSRLRFVTLAGDHVAIVRTVALPAAAAEIVWVGTEPIVLLAGGGEVGRITPTGYVAFSQVPAARWTVAQPSEFSELLTHPMWQLTVDAAGAVWEGHCDWGHETGAIAWHGAGTGNWCDAWAYARVLPGSTEISHVAPKPAAEPELPEIAPSTTTVVELVDADPAILRCTVAGTTVEYPEADAREYFRGVSDLTWLATTPPMYRVVETSGDGNRPSHDETVIFEGCARSDDYAQASIVIGPHGLTAILGHDKVSIRRNGIELGTLEAASLVRFAPATISQLRATP